MPGLEHVPPFEHAGVQIADVHRVPLHPVAQVQVPGLLQVPPFEHTGVQTAKGNGMF